MAFDRIGNVIHEGDLVEFPLPSDYHIVVATVEHVEDAGVLAVPGGQGPKGMTMPAKVVLHIDIKCNLVDLTNQGIFRQLVVVKNPKANEPAGNA